MSEILINNVYNDDCFNVLKNIPDKSVSLVLVDPPYGNTQLVWDKKIDLEKMWIELKRIGKSNCNYVFFCMTRFGMELILSNPKWFRYDLVWAKKKAMGFLDAKKRPLRNFEMIYIFQNNIKPKDAERVYNPQMTEGKPFSRLKDQNLGRVSHYRQLKNEEPKYKLIENNGTRFPKSVLEFSVDIGVKTIHPTQKPVAVCEWLVKTYSNEGDLVLDFCMGSGSTIIACLNTNRQYIGVEKDAEIFEKSSQRIIEHITTMEDPTSITKQYQHNCVVVIEDEDVDVEESVEVLEEVDDIAKVMLDRCRDELATLSESMNSLLLDVVSLQNRLLEAETLVV